MALEIHTRPLEHWPRQQTPAGARKSAPFKTKFDVTLRKLRFELAKLKATTVVLQVAFAEKDISVTTGLPRADRNPEFPGVIVAADTKFGALKWACDICCDWTDNVHAIALTLERLRLADLYGVTSKGEQYTGWKLLPGPITASAGAAPPMSIEEAARFVARISGASAATLINSRKAWEEAYRDAARKLHPDTGAKQEDWKKLQDARQLLDGLHGRK